MQSSTDLSPPFARRFFKPRYFAGLALVLLAWGCLSRHQPPQVGPGASLRMETAMMTVTVDSVTGAYSVEQKDTGWRFSGSLDERLIGTERKSGSDPLGNFTSISFGWDDKGPVKGEIRTYTDRPAVMFLMTCGSARPAAPSAFPTLTTPAKLHAFGYTNGVFSPRSFKGGKGASPWLFFDDSNKSVIISPANNFMVADVYRDYQKNLASGLNKKLANLPEGFTHETLLVTGDSIHQAWDRWGHDLTDLAGKVRPANDQAPELAKFGYWTDNGAYYYYNYDLSRGYDGTLLDVADAYRKQGIPLGYMQLDSWWYFKSKTSADGKEGKIKNAKLPEGTWNCYGGLMEYKAHPAVFRQGLAAFDQQLNMPLITHNRWVDLHSPYRKEYTISGVGAIDPKWWDDVADYLKSSGVVVYEQDWLNEIYNNSPEFASTTTAGAAFMDNMARATKARGMRMQYCMELPYNYLQGSKYDNLTSVRVAGDRFERGKWEDALYTSQMASSLGEWPWVDTFNSAEYPNMILATLTAGPVGVGDAIDKIDAKNIRMCIRPDGVIVKPDTAIVPIDQTYVSDAGDRKSPMIAAAYTDHDTRRTAYVFAFPRSADQMAIVFSPAELGVASDAWIYEPATGKGTLVYSGEKFTASFADSNFKKAWSYFVVAPVGKSGIALIGDIGKIAAAGKQRLPKIEETADGVTATVAFAAGEKSVMLHGFSHFAPVMTASTGTLQSTQYGSNTHEFTVEVTPASPDQASAIVHFAVK